jgi:2-dehydro-3-deoxyphosphooctonate aldolase (KDO 8-P synthase)
MNVTLTPYDVVFGADRPFVFIGGPCVIEDRESALYAAQAIKTACDAAGVPLVYKSSYDKANRSSSQAFRGVGMDEGLMILEKVKAEFGVPVLSDVHTPAEVKAAAPILDILQIPAFLCRQTDLLVAAGASGKTVNVKKGQFMAPWDMGNAVAKVAQGGDAQILLTERGTTFGYNTLVVDMQALPIMARFAPVIFDAGHSVQQPGGLGYASGGKREMIPALARAAAAVGVAGIFLECHPDPDRAPCDGPNMWPIDRLADLLKTLAELDKITKNL